MKNQQNKNILLTGGHAVTTALAVIEELIRRNAEGKSVRINWIGSKYLIEGSRLIGPEFSIFPELGVKTEHIISGRLQRKFSLWTIPSLLRIPFGFIHAFILVKKIKPNVVLSFGGYSALPVVIVSWLLKIPIVIHDQTATAGLANRVSGIFAKRICISRETSRKYFDRDKTVITGNPVMTQICEIESKEEIGSPAVICITCGSRGSRVINSYIGKILNRLLTKYKVIHITGGHDYQKYLRIKNELNKKLFGKYEIYSMMDPMHIDNIYKEADIIISRAGANTVSEIMISKRPSILIPIPWSYLNEQMENALIAKENGIAEIIKQDNLTEKTLLQKVFYVERNWKDMVDKVKDKKSLDVEASVKIVNVIEGFL